MIKVLEPAAWPAISLVSPSRDVRTPRRMNEMNQEPPPNVNASPPLIICTMLGLSPSWNWFAPLFDRIRWEFYGGNPRNWLERMITRPALASWRACWESIRAAQR